MTITAKNIVRHELIGLEAEARTKNATIGGRVVDETQQTVTIEGKDGKEKRVVKRECSFVFLLPDGGAEINGALLVGRPEDRIKKKIREW